MTTLILISQYLVQVAELKFLYGEIILKSEFNNITNPFLIDLANTKTNAHITHTRM